MSAARCILRTFASPDERRVFPLGTFETVRLGGMTLGRATYEPGWRWSEHVAAEAGTPLCEVAHLGLVIRGRAQARMRDGEEHELAPGTLFEIPPGHDSWVVGDEPYESIHFLGAESYAAAPTKPAAAAAGILALDHVQLCIPPGGEAVARGFYGGVLGFEEIPKPGTLAARGGCWFRSGDATIHLGVETDFLPARRTHPAFVVADLEALRTRLREEGARIVSDSAIPGVRRFYAGDPFGNRLEFIGAATPSAPGA
jgi:quercetin dioxygenase-like cupin family protein